VGESERMRRSRRLRIVAPSPRLGPFPLRSSLRSPLGGFNTGHLSSIVNSRGWGARNGLGCQRSAAASRRRTRTPCSRRWLKKNNGSSGMYASTAIAPRLSEDGSCPVIPQRRRRELFVVCP
jgi:hypothetical protein